ncbi:MAG: HAD family phosphatase [Clostridia bacterium]|nr:HAD family phosphatase [Clostridia bacterium]
MDGTLVDTEKLYNRFWVEAARHFGYPMEPRHALMLRSLAPEVAEPLMRKEVAPDFDFYTVRAYRREIMETYVDREGLEPKPYMAETLEWFHEKGYRIALATATQEGRARKYLEKLGVLPLFDAIATADMVRHGKPAPDIYLLAMEKLGAGPVETVAVEDSPTGIRSAVASGAHAVMIPDLDQPDAEIRKQCTVFPSLRAFRMAFDQP